MAKPHQPSNTYRADPLSWLGRCRTKIHSHWLAKFYPFAHFGQGVSIHYSCELRRPVAAKMSIDDGVYVAPDVWFNSPVDDDPRLAIVIGKRSQIGRRSVLSARNMVCLEEDVLLAPSVLIMDHNHEFADINRPIHEQGVTRVGW